MRFVKLEYYILLFFFMSMLGWLIEVAVKWIQYGRFINRGFLIGPYCPIYGVGAVLIVLLLSRFKADPFNVFALTMLLCGTLEYATSYTMEKLFHARWWDYSQKRFNLNGRVCAQTLIPFGLLGLALVYWIAPGLWSFFDAWPPILVDLNCFLLVGLLIADITVSTSVLSRIRAAADHLEGDSTEELTRKVRTILSRQGVLHRRTLRAFPRARFTNERIRRQMKEKSAQLKQMAKEKEQMLRQEFEQLEERLRQERKARKDDEA